MKADWNIADRISDRIVDVLNDEADKMRAAKRDDVLQLLAGQLLGLMGTFQTMPPAMTHPASLLSLEAAVKNCLMDIQAAAEKKRKP